MNRARLLLLPWMIATAVLWPGTFDTTDGGRPTPSSATAWAGTPAASVPLRSGLNAFAFPSEVPAGADHCFGLLMWLGGPDAVRRIARPDPRTGRDQACAFDGIIPFGDDFAITPGDGLFVDLALSGDAVVGERRLCPAIDLEPGVNLIGIPTPPADLGCFDVLAALGSEDAATIERLDPESGRFDACAFEPGGQILGTDFPIAPHEAYVVHARRARDAFNANDPSQCGFCGDSVLEPALEQCDGSADAACPGRCQSDCRCAPNQPPTADAGPDRLTTLGTPIRLDASGSSDPEADPLGYAWTLLAQPAGSTTSLDDSTRVDPGFSPEVAGSYVFGLRVDDGVSTSSEDFVTVVATGRSPALQPVGVRNVALGQRLSFALQATDADGDPVRFGATTRLPAGASLDGMSGAFTWRPGADQVGDHPLDFFASDGELRDVQAAVLRVLAPQPGGVTELSGVLLDTSDFTQGTATPVVGAQVALLGTTLSTTSDAEGPFVLSGISGETQVLDIAAASAAPSPDGRPYASFREEVHLIPGVRNELDRAVLLPRLDVLSATTVDPTATTEVRNDALGIGIVIPPGVARAADGSAFTGEMTISIVPDNEAPAALPAALGFEQLITIQPVGVTFATPVPITFPNTQGFLPGSEVEIWSLDPESGVFIVVGTARVSADGSEIRTVSGGVRAADWHGILSPLVGADGEDDENICLADDPNCCCDEPVGSEAAVSSGNLSIVHDLVTYRSLEVERGVRLVYNSLAADPRPIVRFDVTIPVRAAVPQLIAARIGVAGVGQRVGPIGGSVGGPFGNCRGIAGLPFSGGGSVFTDTSQLSEGRDETIRQVVQLDATGYATGVLPYTIAFSSLYRGACPTSIVAGKVLVHNERLSPFGAGWTLHPLQRLHPSDEFVVITEGNGSVRRFRDPVADEATGVADWTSPKGDFSRLQRQPDGTWLRRLKTGVELYFDVSGRQIRQRDPRGNETSYGYTDGRLTSIRDPLDIETRLFYRNGLLERIEDPVGRTTRFEHDPVRNLTGIIDPDGSRRRFVYDLSHHLVEQTSKRGFKTTYLYNSAGRNIGADRPDGSQVRLDPSQTVGLALGGTGTATNPAPPVAPDETLAAYRDGAGGTTFYVTNALGSATERIDALGRSSRMRRDTQGNVVERVRPKGTRDVLTWDAQGNLATLREAVGTADERSSSFEYDARFSALARAVDPQGFDFEIEYNADGTVGILRDHRDVEQTFTYTARGLLETATDRGQRMRSMTYDAMGNLETRTDALGGVTRIVRDAVGRPIRIIVAEGRPEEQTTAYSWDLMNRPTSERDGAGGITELRYDAAGNPVQIIDRTRRTTHLSWDERDRVERVVSPSVGVTTLEYDGEGRVTRTVDGAGQEMRFEYDPAGQLRFARDPLGEIEFRYDDHGNLTELHDRLGQVTRFRHDALDRMVARQAPGQPEARFTWDARGYPDLHTTELGQIVDRDWDDLGRLVEVTTPDDVLRFEYGPEGHLELAEDSDSRVRFTYDALYRLDTATTENLGAQPAVVLDYDYDGRDRRDRTRDSDGGDTRYAHDGADRLRRIEDVEQGVITLSHDPEGRPIGIGWPNGLAWSDQPGARGLPANRVLRGASAELLLAEGLRFDAIANLEQVDERAELRGGSGRVSGLRTVESGDQVSALPDLAYGYDLRGALERRTPSGAPEVRFRYDALGRLTSVEPDGGPPTSYAYDALGRRIGRTTGSAVTRYVYDGPDVRLEFGEDDAVPRARYLHGEQDDQPLAMRRDGENYYLHADFLGSIRRVSDATGEVANAYAYDAYGLFARRVETVEMPYGFAGREYDDESALYHVRARYYDPQTGRFISSDPSGFAGADFNLYRYALGNPINVKDPSGRTPAHVAGGIIGGIAGGVANGLAAWSEGGNATQIAASVLTGIVVGAVAGATLNPVAGGALFGALTKAQRLAFGLGTEGMPCANDRLGQVAFVAGAIGTEALIGAATGAAGKFASARFNFGAGTKQAAELGRSLPRPLPPPPSFPPRPISPLLAGHLARNSGAAGQAAQHADNVASVVGNGIGLLGIPLVNNVIRYWPLLRPF